MWGICHSIFAVVSLSDITCNDVRKVDHVTKADWLILRFFVQLQILPQFFARLFIASVKLYICSNIIWLQSFKQIYPVFVSIFKHFQHLIPGLFVRKFLSLKNNMSDSESDSEVVPDYVYEEKCKTFSSITNVDSSQAWAIMEEHKWNLQVSAANFQYQSL